MVVDESLIDFVILVQHQASYIELYCSKIAERVVVRTQHEDVPFDVRAVVRTT